MVGNRSQLDLIGHGEVLVQFVAPGHPRPQGSKTARVIGGKAVMFELVKGLSKWRKVVAGTARASMHGCAPFGGPCRLTCSFYFERYPSHFTSTGKLKKSAPTFPTHRDGDLSKLVRAVEDAISEIVIVDDIQVEELSATKEWSDAGAVVVTVEAL